VKGKELRNGLSASAAALALAAVLAPCGARAQLLSRATIRGRVLDEQQQPIADVAVQLEFKGETRRPLVRKTKTNKKGEFLYAGLPEGLWQITLTKEGYKPGGFQTNLEGGAIGEMPPYTLQKAPQQVAAPAMPAIDTAKAAAEAKNKEVAEGYRKAAEAMEAGNYADAEQLFKDLLAKGPDLPQAHYYLGYLASRRKDPKIAEDEYRKAIALKPDLSDFYIALAELLGEERRPADAYKLLQDTATRFPEDSKFQFALGVAAFNQGQSAPAEAAFEKATQLDPKANVEGLYFLGTLALSRGDVKTSVARLETYVASAPETSPNVPVARKLLDKLKSAK
jgi:Tfp pilus assembly protein PilF